MTGPNLSLHNLVTVLRAPSVVLSDQDGQIHGDSLCGWFARDKRALAVVQVTLGDSGVVTVGHRHDEPSVASFHAVARESGAQWRDSTVHVRRDRRLFPSSLQEDVEVTNHGEGERLLTCTVRLATDFAGVDAVKAGRAASFVPPVVDGGRIAWLSGKDSVTLSAEPRGEVEIGPDGVVQAMWQIRLGGGESWRLELVAESSFAAAEFEQVPARTQPQWTLPANSGAGPGLADLRALLLADPAEPADSYLAAGSPWYLTLFGRDSIWAARLLLPLGTEVAEGTLRTLARRQGSGHDPETEQQPGKILHEMRSGAIDTGQVRLSSRYYGTIDATPLWICLLHEAWRAGMPDERVRALMPNLLAAMGWLTGADADPDGDGLIEYLPSSSGGLTHQGWKDSHDAFLHHDGRHPAAPIALCEVQGYAYAAALAGAELARAFDEPDAPQWTAWAARLKRRFRDAFWVEDSTGRYPAIALDADKKPVEGATSNMAHLLGTGLLDPAEAALVAERLGRADMITGFGLRTLSAASPMYNPFSYHRGSIWPHDTAIAMIGLAAEGHHPLATHLATGILRATTHFGGHIPELYAVLDETPLAYPAACVPQAWSAAAAVRCALYLSSTAA
ncbi:glycogen debranching N-terminal domain-containing protein [Actinocrispum sp. NPDC049592]|uniref:glycogen debranching N-terminal domain-containing protein n=1 Tax=Actinocrispum sp. NPDC049592 TaxID=3154835 RepID=UPI003415CEA4